MKTNEVKSSLIPPGWSCQVRCRKPWRWDSLMRRKSLWPTSDFQLAIFFGITTRQVVWEVYVVCHSTQELNIFSCLWLRTHKQKTSKQTNNGNNQIQKSFLPVLFKMSSLAFTIWFFLVEPLWQHRLLYMSYFSAHRPCLHVFFCIACHVPVIDHVS